jgi:hypothetical protein
MTEFSYDGGDKRSDDELWVEALKFISEKGKVGNASAASAEANGGLCCIRAATERVQFGIR